MRVPTRWLEALPALVLAVVAGHQLWLARSAGLSPWSGGGFGMFSTTDVWANRHLHAYALRPGLRRELDVPRSLAEPLRRALALPDEARLRALAEELAELPTPDQGPLEAIELQVFARRHDPGTLEPSGELVGALRVRFDGR
jgi:hypothetical protein